MQRLLVGALGLLLLLSLAQHFWYMRQLRARNTIWAGEYEKIAGHLITSQAQTEETMRLAKELVRLVDTPGQTRCIP